MIISFAKTTPALLAGHKTVTRRDWKDSHARKFHVGMVVDAWSNGPHRGGEHVGTIRLTHDPYRERACDAPDEDFEREGFVYLSEHGIEIDGMSPHRKWNRWMRSVEELWVVRFELLS